VSHSCMLRAATASRRERRARRSSDRSRANPSEACQRSSERSSAEGAPSSLAPRSPAMTSHSRARSAALASATVSRSCRLLHRASVAGWSVTSGFALIGPSHPRATADGSFCGGYRPVVTSP
jgi:hypothetical protein